jgi:fumarate hydratase class II
MKSYRIAEDTLGKVPVPEDAYYGAQTQRAIDNFPISGRRLPRSFIRAQGMIKASAAAVHLELGQIQERIALAVIQASEEVAEGQWDEQFQVDVYQAGAGTSQNMNANEVIASRALELLNEPLDRYDLVHPNDIVNKSQSTNDTIPTALNMAAVEMLDKQLLPNLERMHEVLSLKSDEFKSIVKTGRTHLQDAVPMTLGQEFAGYAYTVSTIINSIEYARNTLLEIGIGGNAVGTGINTHARYSEMMLIELTHRTGVSWRGATTKFAALQNPTAAFRLSGSLREMAVHLIKLSSDLRLLASGPNTGIAEIQLPAVQPGSSIMPGKVNPVMAEMITMVGTQIIGNDAAIQAAMTESQLEINVMTPVIIYNLLDSIMLLSNAVHSFTAKCLEGIQADSEQCKYWMNKSLALVTLLSPIIGYEKASSLAKQSIDSGTSIEALAKKEANLSEEDWQELIENSIGQS